MTEIEALLKIASAVNNLAAAFAGIGTVAWLALLFKSMSAQGGVNRLADVAERWLQREKDKMR